MRSWCGLFYTAAVLYPVAWYVGPHFNEICYYSQISYEHQNVHLRSPPCNFKPLMMWKWELRCKFGCPCWITGPFEFRWSKGYIYNSSYYLNQIGSIILPLCYHIFLWLCAWSGCNIICCRFHISLENLFCVFYICLIFICLHTKLPHYNHYADISEGIELLKCLS